MWLQCSRIAWLKEGDSNMGYFHRQAVWRARKNHIKKLKDDEGNWCDKAHGLKQMTTDFFMRSYEADPGVILGELLDLTEAKVTEAITSSCASSQIKKFWTLYSRWVPSRP